MQVFCASPIQGAISNAWEKQSTPLISTRKNTRQDATEEKKTGAANQEATKPDIDRDDREDDSRFNSCR